MFTEAFSEPQRLDRDRNPFGAIPGNDGRWAADDDAPDNEALPVISVAPASRIIWPRVWPGL